MHPTSGSPERLRTRGEAGCEAVVEASWLIALLVVPVFFNPFSRSLFEPDRAVLLELVAGLGAVAWAGRVAAGGRLVLPLPASPLRRLQRALLVAVAAVAAATALSATLALEPTASWRGAWPRGYGAATQLALLALLALLLAHLRREAQRRRLLFAAVAGSIPVALYGLLQAAGRDPVTWTRTIARVHSTLGNPIFLGAYIVPVAFLTAAWIAAVRPDAAAPPGAPRRTSLPVAAGVYALVLQTAVCLLSQSRGPLLALAFGAVLLVLLTLARPRVRRTRLLAATSAATLLLGAVVLAAPVERGNRWLGRLTRTPWSASSSVQVRLLAWHGIERALSSPSPEGAARPLDGGRHLRPWLGYGPEMVRAATAGSLPEELAVREPGRALDRAHNEGLELLVTVGVLGLAAWLAVWLIGLEIGLSLLGMAPAGSGDRLWRAAVLGAGALGAAAPWLATGSWSLSGLGAGLGLVAGCAATAVAARVRHPAAPGAHEALLPACLVVAVLAHLVEVQVGITVVASRLAAFAALGLLATMPGRTRGGDDPTERTIPPGLLAVATGALGTVLVFGLTQPQRGALSAAGVVVANLRGGPVTPLFALAGLTALTLALLAAGAIRRGPAVLALAAGGATAAGFLAVHAHRLAHDVELARSCAEAGAIVAHVGGHVVLLLAATAAAVLVTAGVLARDRRDPPAASDRPWRTALAVVLGLAGLAFVLRPALAELHADTALKNAAGLQAVGRGVEALALARAARQRVPDRAWAALAAAETADAVRRTAPPALVPAAVAECREALAAALRLAPFSLAGPAQLPACGGTAPVAHRPLPNAIANAAQGPHVVEKSTSFEGRLGGLESP